jgi:hypothetical protein
MTESDRNPDSESQFAIPPGLRDDLQALYKPDSTVPPEVDRAILDRVHRRLVNRKRPFRRIRWAASAASVAAAAVVIIVVSLERPRDTAPPSAARFTAALALPSDIDQNGRVDILDAFKLARNIESTSLPKIEWDINRDGMVNRDDVDYVAFAAVRLNKGV